MSAMQVVVVVGVVGVASFVLVGFVTALFTIIRKISAHTVSTAAADHDIVGATTTTPALMEGGVSESGGTLNGVGVLAIFPAEVRFVLRVPKRTITIPRTAITAVEVTQNLKLPGVRRAGGPPFLMIDWISPHGPRKTGFQTDRADELLAELRPR